MARVRCHYEGCIHLEANYCGADVIELDPEMGCLTFAQEEDLGDEEDWDDVLLDEEEEAEDWEELDEELEDDLDLDDEEDEW